MKNLNISNLTSDLPEGDSAPVEGEPTPAVEEIPGTEQTKIVSDAAVALLTTQIGHEMFAHYEYTAISSWFACKGLDGFACWASKQACDEVGHAKKVLNFLIELDINPTLPAIEAATAQFESVAKAVAAIMLREKGVTANWRAIGVQALTDQDMATLELSQWFIKEQMEEENLVKTILQRIEIAGEGSGIIVLDIELQEKYGA